MSHSSLFRTEAVDGQRVPEHGDIVTVQAKGLWAVTALFSMLAAGLVCFVVLGSYARRTTVKGQLVPTEGLIKVYTQEVGTVIEQEVKEGQHVHQGDVLFVLSSDRQSTTMGDTQAAISRETRARARSLHEELLQTSEMQRLERESLTKKRASLHAEVGEIQVLIGDQKIRYQLAEADLDRYRSIAESGYVSQDELTAREAEVLDQKSKLESLGRDLISVQRDLSDTQYSLDTLALKYDGQIGDIERGIASAEGDLSESEARRRFTVIAPSNGTATAITAHAGQTADPNEPLLAILPDESQLEAELYAPSQAIGFAKAGGLVHMRYQAYPYERFGEYTGRITYVARTALTAEELTGRGAAFGSSAQQEEPLYRITVSLQSQFVRAYGRPQRLKAGMVLEADVLLERRKLYQWVLEPLYALSGKL